MTTYWVLGATATAMSERAPQGAMRVDRVKDTPWLVEYSTSFRYRQPHEEPEPLPDIDTGRSEQ